MSLLRPDHFVYVFFSISVIVFSILASWLVQPSVWEMLGLDRVAKYKKAGEYGEANQARASRAADDAIQR